jgi:hypothetical protein
MAKLSDTSRFKADKGFKGAESGQRGNRDAPVQFEKASVHSSGIAEPVGQKRPRHDDDDE